MFSLFEKLYFLYLGMIGWSLQHLHTKTKTARNQPFAETHVPWTGGGASTRPHDVLSYENMCRLVLPLLPQAVPSVVLSGGHGEDVIPDRSCATSPFHRWVQFVPTALTSREVRRPSFVAGGRLGIAAAGRRDGDEAAERVGCARVLLLQRCRVGRWLQLRR